jgi:hypothetical protein
MQKPTTTSKLAELWPAVILERTADVDNHVVTSFPVPPSRVPTVSKAELPPKALLVPITVTLIAPVTAAFTRTRVLGYGTRSIVIARVMLYSFSEALTTIAADPALVTKPRPTPLAGLTTTADSDTQLLLASAVPPIR